MYEIRIETDAHGNRYRNTYSIATGKLEHSELEEVVVKAKAPSSTDKTGSVLDDIFDNSGEILGGVANIISAFKGGSAGYMPGSYTPPPPPTTTGPNWWLIGGGLVAIILLFLAFTRGRKATAE